MSAPTCDHHGDACGCAARASSLAQTLSEMDFERSLWGACVAGNTARASALLARRPAAANDRDAYGYTPLLYAARAGRLGCVELLLAGGADVNAALPGSLATALHRAAQQGHEAVCRLLVAAGADLAARDAHGKTPYDLAGEGNHAFAFLQT